MINVRVWLRRFIGYPLVGPWSIRRARLDPRREFPQTISLPFHVPRLKHVRVKSAPENDQPAPGFIGPRGGACGSERRAAGEAKSGFFPIAHYLRRYGTRQMG